ncbi:MAG: adenylate/guanylate cyclase domain-containing protein [Myxococcales bacterium]|nr:adenylate/guanylate cyclase domain-containing protein [Myxococcales bacterium]MCB9754177.1 adenylate/guanylate cyclase domain-containing protein [Myxococcales bacterium]
MQDEPEQPHTLVITNTQSLLDALDRRGVSDAERRAFDDSIWSARGVDASILVTDLSGFTRLTRRHGIIHFLAVFRRCQNICLPLITGHGGFTLKQDADDLIALFPDPSSAVAAALGMIKAAHELNTTLDEDDRVGLCIGVEHGRMLRLDDDAFGDPVNVAFKLGEDIAEAGEVLIGASAFARVEELDYDFTGYSVSEARGAETGKVVLEHRAVRWVGDDPSGAG